MLIESQNKDKAGSERYFNRDLSWIEFNRRVLQEAQDADTPLLERAKFLAIVSSNLDEFMAVRVAETREKIKAGFMQKDFTGYTLRFVQTPDQAYRLDGIGTIPDLS